MSNNPFALDFTGLNEGLAALGAGLGKQNAQQGQASAAQQFADLLRGKTTPMYTDAEANTPRYEPGYSAPIPGGQVSENISPLLAMLSGESIAPIANTRNGTFTQPGQMGMPNAEAEAAKKAATTTIPPTRQELEAGMAAIQKANPTVDFSKLLETYKAAQGIANAPEDRAMAIESHKANLAKEGAQTEWYKDRGISVTGWTDSAGVYHPPTAVQGAQVRADGTVTAAGIGADSREKVAAANAQSKEKIGAAHDASNTAIAAARNAASKLTGEARTRAALTIAKMNSENKAANLTGAAPVYTADDINNIFGSILPDQATVPGGAPPAPAASSPAGTPSPAAEQEPARPVQPRAIVDPKVVAKFAADPATKGMTIGNKDKTGKYTVYLNGVLHGHFE